MPPPDASPLTPPSRSSAGPVPPEPDLAGRVVLVFGAGSSAGGDGGPGNGEAAARAYAAAGATVVALDRDPDEAERVAATIADEGGRATALEVDVTDEARVAEVVARAVEAHGPPHVLHNNVGSALVGSVIDVGTDAWEASLRLNLTSAFLTSRHVLPHMLAAGRGVVVNVSSVAAIRDTGYVYPAYSAAKAGLDQLTVSLASTYADRGIRANAILPGLIDTPLAASFVADDPAAVRERHAASPTGRMGSPWDVANVAVFLASDRAAYVNGVCLPVDGGLSARCR